MPFSYSAVTSSSAFKAIEGDKVEVKTTIAEADILEDSAVEQAERPRGRKPLNVDFGQWTVDEIQICEMGSYGPEGEYVSVGNILL